MSLNVLRATAPVRSAPAPLTQLPNANQINNPLLAPLANMVQSLTGQSMLQQDAASSPKSPTTNQRVETNDNNDKVDSDEGDSSDNRDDAAILRNATKHLQTTASEESGSQKHRVTSPPQVNKIISKSSTQPAPNFYNNSNRPKRFKAAATPAPEKKQRKERKKSTPARIGLT